jgi:signal peptidase II
VPARSDVATRAGVALSVLLADQISKELLRDVIGPGTGPGRISLVGSWLEFEYAQNRGAAFGLLPQLGSFLGLASMAILIGLLWQFARESHPSWWQTAATGAIAGGAIGNLLDRARLGYVVDFIAIGPWPNFNVADSAITVGALLLCWGWLRTNFSGDTNPAG